MTMISPPVSHGLSQVPQLTRLNLSYNCSGPEGTQSLTLALRSLPHLKSLDLHRFSEDMRRRLLTEGMQALALGLASRPSLTCLRLGHDDIDDERLGLIALADALQNTPKLERLDLEWNQCSEPGTVALARALRHLLKSQAFESFFC